MAYLQLVLFQAIASQGPNEDVNNLMRATITLQSPH